MAETWAARPSLGTDFYKAHGLGNDYLVFTEGDDVRATSAAVEAICERLRGPGGDGIVVLLADRSEGVFRLRMFNPDGGEFERSGNGLRVLGSYLHREGLVDDAPFTIEVGGDRVEMTVHGHADGAYDISVDMGAAEVGPAAVAMDPAALDGDGRLSGPDGRALDLVAVGVGNPHLVVWSEPLTTERLHEVGPHLTSHPSLANGTNVQLAEVTGPDRCRALIWERGVGPTTASGTSSCAVAVAAVSRGMAPGPIHVDMAGGSLTVTVRADRRVVLRGPVEEVMTARLAPDFVQVLRDR